MDAQTILNAVLVVVSGSLGWFARELWTAVKDLKTDLAKLREDLPKDYVMKDDYRTDIARVHDLLDKIWSSLNKKADR